MDRVTGSITLQQALPDSLFLSTVTPTAFSFYDGHFTLDTHNYNSLYYPNPFMVATDTNGDIVQWNVELIQSSIENFIISENHLISMDIFDDVGFPACCGSGGLNIDEGISDTPGVWSGPIPEPSTIYLLAISLLGVFLGRPTMLRHR